MEEFNIILAHKIIHQLPDADKRQVEMLLESKDKFIADLQKDNRDMSEVFEKMLDYGRRGRIHKVG
jgi:hypothetical protein